MKRGWLAWAGLLGVVSVALGAEEGAKIFFSRSFPGSAPAYFEITVGKDGAVEYREDPEDEEPLKLKLAGADARVMFLLAEKLNRFQRPLESGRAVAKTGVKVFRYMEGESNHRVEFNYSDDLDAQALLSWFERIGESARIYLALERAIKYDRLGVNQAVVWLQVAHEKQRLVAHERFIPLLERVVKNSSYLNMARSRAASLIDAFRAVSAASP